MSTRRGISLSTENFVCCSRNAIFCACKILRSFADNSSKMLISRVVEFYTRFIMIIQKNRRVRTSRQNLIHFVIRWNWKKHLSTSIKYRKFPEKYKKYMLAGILLHIIKFKTTYSHKSHHYGGCNQSLTSRASTQPISRKVKPAIQNYSAQKERRKFLFSVEKLTLQLKIILRYLYSYIIFNSRFCIDQSLRSYYLKRSKLCESNN